MTHEQVSRYHEAAKLFESDNDGAAFASVNTRFGKEIAYAGIIASTEKPTNITLTKAMGVFMELDQQPHCVENAFLQEFAEALLVAHLRRSLGSTDGQPARPKIDEEVNTFLREKGILQQ